MEEVAVNAPALEVEKSKDKEYNFAVLRRKEEQQRAEIARLKSELASVVNYDSLKEAGVNPDDFIEGKQVVKLLKSEAAKAAQMAEERILSQVNAQLDNRFKEYKDQHSFAYLQAETQGRYGQVVNEASMKEWAETSPLVFKTVTAIEDPIERRVAMMEAVSNFQSAKANANAITERLEQLTKNGSLHPQSYTMAMDNGTVSRETFIKNAPFSSLMDIETQNKILIEHMKYQQEKGGSEYMKLMNNRVSEVINSNGMSSRPRENN